MQEELKTQVPQQTVFPVLLAVSFCHLLNDSMQSVLFSIYPVLKSSLYLSYGQIGLITFCFQVTASLLQPLVGYYTDRRPQPYSIAIGMGFTLAGLISLSLANHFYMVLVSASLIGLGSSVFHPEASRLAYLTSGGKRGLAQSIFQVGGNTGSAIGPLIPAMIIYFSGHFYQSDISWFFLFAITGIIILYRIGGWYKEHHVSRERKKQHKAVSPVSKKTVVFSLFILLVLMFSKYFYMSSMTNYFTFYLMEKFRLKVEQAQFHLFLFLAAIAAGTLLGGPIGDRIGRKYVIWISILGVAPFTLLMPYSNLFWTTILSVVIGFVLSSAFSAILVYAQELLPGNVGMISGLFFGLAFGLGGIGAAVLGDLAQHTSITYVYHLCAFLPLLGLFTVLLPDIEKKRK